MSVNIIDTLTQNFIDFSYEANSQRAFPDARDGLKPGQRACVWEMFNKGYVSSKPHVKSAKVSGGVIGNWWPHGDVAVYDTFVRMSQPWINNIPEIDGHGNFGSQIIPDSWANQRYTEVRLSKAVEDGMLQGLKKNNVPMIQNFTEDMLWPEVLPAIYPRLLVNGCQGIGSTIANTWLPNNLKEAGNAIEAYIKTGEIIPLVPDFPTGGVIINGDNLECISKTGKGGVIVRAVATIKGADIIVTQLPYRVYVEPLVEEIKQLLIDEKITGIKDVKNNTDRKHGMQIVIECEKGASPDRVLSQLYKCTSLQSTYNANQYALVGKTPILLNQKEYMDIYISHNIQCLRKEYMFDLEKAKARLEIVEGLLKALVNIDEIIKLIKQSDSSDAAMLNLIKEFEFTTNQAKAIVAMKLGSLAHLEAVALEKEKQGLTSSIEKIEEILANDSLISDEFLSKLKSFINKYGVDRKTKITQIKVGDDGEEPPAPEEVMVSITEGGSIKRFPKSALKVQKRGGKGIKNPDENTLCILSTNTVDTLLLFTNDGLVYKLLVDKIPTTSTYLGELIKLKAGSKVVAASALGAATNPEYIVFVTKNGLLKKSCLSEYTSLKKSSGTKALNIKEGDGIVQVLFMDNESMLLVTRGGMSIRFATKDIKPLGRIAAGVKGINLSENDEVISAMPIKNDKQFITVLAESGKGKRVSVKEFIEQGRGGKGSQVYKDIVNVAFISEGDNDMVIAIAPTKKTICFSISELPKVSKVALGNIVHKDGIIGGCLVC